MSLQYLFMKRQVINLAACVAFTSMAGWAAASTPKPVPTSLPGAEVNLNGQWYGVLSKSNSKPGVTDVAMLMTLNKVNAKVAYQNENGVFEDVMPGQFQISRQGSNLVMHGTDSGKDAEDRWVETWVFALTYKSDDALRVGYLRVVNNVTIPSSDPDKAAAYGLSGAFVRITPAFLADKQNSPVVQVTAEALGRFSLRGKTMSAAELKTELLAERERHPITAVRLLEGETPKAVGALGLKDAYFERAGQIESMTTSGGE
jgi:hypothetical protein